MIGPSFVVFMSLGLLGSSTAKQLSMSDLENMVNELGDEILTHRGLASGSLRLDRTTAHDVTPGQDEMDPVSKLDLHLSQ